MHPFPELHNDHCSTLSSRPHRTAHRPIQGMRQTGKFNGVGRRSRITAKPHRLTRVVPGPGILNSAQPGFFDRLWHPQNAPCFGLIGHIAPIAIGRAFGHLPRKYATKAGIIGKSRRFSRPNSNPRRSTQKSLTMRFVPEDGRTRTDASRMTRFSTLAGEEGRVQYIRRQQPEMPATS